MSVRASAFGLKEPALFTDKFLRLKYSDLENPDILQLRRKIQASSAINKHGIYSFIDSFNSIIIQGINMFLSLLLSYQLFVIIFVKAVHWGMILLFFILLILIVFSFYMNYFSSKKMSIKSTILSDSMLMINRINNDTNAYNKGKDIRLYNLDIPIMQEEQYRLTLNQNSYKAYHSFLFLYTLPNKLLSHLINGCIYMIVCMYAVWGLLEIGSVIKYVALFNRLINSMQEIFDTIVKMKTNEPFLKEYFSFFDLKEEEIEKALTIPYGKSYEFEFQNVSFQYSGTDRYAIKNLNVKFSLDKKIVFVGMNGSGKTTFVKLLIGMYKPTSGKILCNGIDISLFDFKDYIKLFSVVFQDFSLFSFTLGQNVAANTTYDNGKVIESLEKVDFIKRFSNMTEQLNTYLYKDFDEQGIEISGGEAQKIALARAIYKDAAMMILDEPTAELDPIAEYNIYQFIINETKDKPALFISHRLSVCPIADEIFVFQEGNIVQRGTHHELIKSRNSLYNEMMEAQARYYM